MPNLDPSLDTAADGKTRYRPHPAEVLDRVPFRLSTEDGIDAVRQRLRDLPRRPLHPELRSRPDHQRTSGSDRHPDLLAANRPDRVVASPVLLFFHGGGFVMGDLDTHDGTARQHAVGATRWSCPSTTGWPPSTPTPPPSKTLGQQRYGFSKAGPENGADPTRMAVAGDSAGGTIAAVIAQRARDEGRRDCLSIVVVSVHAVGPVAAVVHRERDALILDTKAVADLSRWYAGEVDLSDPPVGMAPGRAENLAGLAPAYIAVAGHDPLRDDGIRYGELLAAAGVPAEVHNAETMVHGYVGYAGVVPPPPPRWSAGWRRCG